jgi:hypothetical protein
MLKGLAHSFVMGDAGQRVGRVNEIKDTRNPAVPESFIRRYSSPLYANLARAKLMIDSFLLKLPHGVTFKSKVKGLFRLRPEAEAL